MQFVENSALIATHNNRTRLSVCASAYCNAVISLAHAGRVSVESHRDDDDQDDGA